MTAALERRSAARPAPRRALVAVEARRTATSPAVWIGIAVSTYFLWASRDVDFSAGTYQASSASFAGAAAGIVALGVVVGGRDRELPGGPLAADAVVGDDERATARLLGMWPAVLAASAFTAVVFAVERITGGHWIGDRPGVVSDVVHGPAEMLQPVLLFVLAATAGVAAGRATAQRALVAVLGVVVVGTFGFFSWAWQWRPAIFLTPVQVQPIEIDLGPAVDPMSLPRSWRLSAPDLYHRNWARVVVDSTMAAWHDVYLLGLAAICAALAIRRGPARVLAAVGVGLTVLGVVAQVVVAPAGFGG